MQTALGKRIVEARKAAGIPAAVLADRLGVRATTVWRWEQHGAVPDAIRFKKLAEVCGVSMASLLEGVDDAPAEDDDNSPSANQVAP